jgi:hypothetical protein
VKYAATFFSVFFAESTYGAKKNGHGRFCCSMTLQDHTAVNQQHTNLNPLDTQFYHNHNIPHSWPHRTTFHSTKRKKLSAGENSLPVMTWREISVTLCVLSARTGRMPLFESYQSYGNGVRTDYVKSATVRFVARHQLDSYMFNSSPPRCTLYSLFLSSLALHVSGAICTHHQVHNCSVQP